jgi:hypothetical protein
MGDFKSLTHFIYGLKEHMNGHHLIMGSLTDLITGEELQDTHDERYRQKLAHLLIEEKEYTKSEITPRMDLEIRAGDKRAIIKIDYGITLMGRLCMILKYGPGSIVTRRRPALAASRLLTDYQVPVVVVTNGEAAEILDGTNGEVTAIGLDAVPTQAELLHQVRGSAFAPIEENRAEMESRIMYAFEVDGSCPCDDTICRL